MTAAFRPFTPAEIERYLAVVYTPDPLLAKAGHGPGAHLTWPDAVALVAAMACSTVIIVVLIVLTARQGAKR